MDKDITSFLLNLLQTKGSDLQYGNENVTQLEHALQCAELTEKNNFSKEIITAALLHDIGHLLYNGKDPIHKGKDGHHENLGADYLSKYFGEEVTLPFVCNKFKRNDVISLSIQIYISYKIIISKFIYFYDKFINLFTHIFCCLSSCFMEYYY